MAKKTKSEEEPQRVEAKRQQNNEVVAWVKQKSQDRKFKGHVQIDIAGNLTTAYTLRRRTGILGLDIGLGGGFHAGGGVQIYGPESVGKTYVVFRTGGEIQRIYGNNAAIYIYCTEIKPDKGFARCAGMCVAYSEKEIDDYDFIRQARGLPQFTPDERADLRMQIGEVVIGTAENAEMGLEGVLNAVESKLFQLVIIESLGALLPKDVDEGDLDDGHYGGSSRAVTNFQNKLYKHFMMADEDGSTNQTTIIGINQARAVIGGGPRGPKTKPAADAYAWKHGQLASVELSRGADIKDPTTDSVIGKEVRWKLTKGKAGTHDGRKGTFNFYHINKTEPIFWKDYLECWLGGVDIAETVETGKNLEVLKIAGSWVTWEAEGKEILRCQGIENFAQKLAEDEALIERFREDCIRKSRLLVRYK